MAKGLRNDDTQFSNGRFIESPSNEHDQYVSDSSDQHGVKPSDGLASLKAPRLQENGVYEKSNGHLSRDGEGGDIRDKNNGHAFAIVESNKSPALSRRRGSGRERSLKLSPERIIELTSSPDSLPLSAASGTFGQAFEERFESVSEESAAESCLSPTLDESAVDGLPALKIRQSSIDPGMNQEEKEGTHSAAPAQASRQEPRPSSVSRAASTPVLRRRFSGSKSTGQARNLIDGETKLPKVAPPSLRLHDGRTRRLLSEADDPEPSPMPSSMPVPPLSLSTFLQLELSSQRPSPLYIHRSVTSDFPYESSRVKIERLLNFLLLPPQLEQVLWFGALSCLDAWLHTFTILPLRFFKALTILAISWGHNVGAEAQFLASFIYAGLGRMWQRRGSLNSQNPTLTKASDDQASDPETDKAFVPATRREQSRSDLPTKHQSRRTFMRRHRRTKSVPSALLPDHKADILKGLLILLSSSILMYFDASRMYHGIRGQAAIKLYVIYNVLEVCDRLFSAIGQDVLECLFSKESLERNPDGRSKIWRPLWLFVLALAYNLVHATALFYQVITLNVAVNSYSNALLTLLMSNQFVEVKSTVFKKFEKENLFQLTCADVVERFQLWLMLMIIASRNIIETGGLIVNTAGGLDTASPTSPSFGILPKSFTFFPSVTGQIFGPFFIVLGSEMLVDWVKHAYITKFNSTKPAIYGRFLDVLTKDYYSHAFADQNLTKRLGLPVIPLACLFIRASVQTYHMFLATHMPLPTSSPSTSISVSNNDPTQSPVADPITLELLFRRAIGRSSSPSSPSDLSSPPAAWSFWTWTPDDWLTISTTLVFLFLIYLVLLSLKLLLGMSLLRYARHRYRGMKERESIIVSTDGRRIGGWGVVEVDEDKRRWIYADDPDGARKLRDREKEAKVKTERDGGRGFEGVERYSMVGKRIW